LGVVLGAGAGLALPGADVLAAPATPDATTILNHVDDVYRGKSSHGILSMKVVTANWTRELRVEVWSEGKDRSLARILAPKKEAGTATLRAGDNIWNFLPKVNRVVKIPSSMMSGSWMGSHFTNDDLVKSSRMADDYDCATQTGDGHAAPDSVTIACTPKKNAPVVWGRLTVTVHNGDWLPLSIQYFDEDLKLARTMTFSDVRSMGGRSVPTTMRIKPTDKPGEATEIRYEMIEFDVKLPSDLFTLRNLQR